MSDANTVRKEALTILIEACRPPSDTLLETILDLVDTDTDKSHYIIYQANQHAPKGGFPSHLTTDQLLELLSSKKDGKRGQPNQTLLLTAKTLFSRPDLTAKNLFSLEKMGFEHYDVWREACENAVEKMPGTELLDLLLAANTPKIVFNYARVAFTNPKFGKVPELSAVEIDRLFVFNKENTGTLDYGLLKSVANAFLHDKEAPFLLATLVESPHFCLCCEAGERLAILLSRQDDQMNPKVCGKICRRLYRYCVETIDNNFHYASSPVLRFWFAKQSDASLLRTFRKRPSATLKATLAIELATRPTTGIKTLMEIEAACPNLHTDNHAINVFHNAYVNELTCLTTEIIMALRRGNSELQLLKHAALSVLRCHPHYEQLRQLAEPE